MEPRLAFQLNGSAFDSAAAGTPFAQSRKAEATFKVAALDLRPFLGYLPAQLPVKLLTAIVDADVRIAFEQSPRVAVRVSGMVQASNVKLVDVKAHDLLSLESFKVGLDDGPPAGASGAFVIA